MSSIYRILCLSHDPAIPATELDADSLAQATTLREAIQTERLDHAPSHPTCDLVIGRYSYPLIEVICYGNATHQHSVPVTQSVKFLRLFFALLSALDENSKSPLFELTVTAAAPCWTPQRLHLLRNEIQ